MKPTGCTPSKSPGKYSTEVVDKEIEVLKERLEILEKQKALARKEQELEDLRNANGSSCMYMYLRNDFSFSDILRSMNAMGHAQSK